MKRQLLLAAGTLGLYALACMTLWPENEWRPDWDSALYLLTARSLAEGEGYTYLRESFFLRPPGFPWLLSLFILDGEYPFALLNRLIMACVALSVVTLLFALRQVCSGWTALGVSVLAGTSVLYVEGFNWVLSEFPFAVLFFAAIAALEASGARGRRWLLWAALGALFLAAAIYMRSVGLLLLPGLLLVGARRDRGRQRWRTLVPLLAVVALLLPWWRYAREAAARAPIPSDQLLLHDYMTALLRVSPGDPGSALVPLASWVERVIANGNQIGHELARALLGSESSAAGVAIALVVVAGWSLRVARRPSLFEWFAFAYALLTLTYFANAKRLVLPMAPFVYFYFFALLGYASDRLAARLSWPRLPAMVQSGAFALLLALNSSMLPRSLAAAGWARGPTTTGEAWEEVRAAAAWLRENTPEDAVILCRRAPILSLLTGRRAYTFRFAPRSDLLSKYEIDYVLVDGAAAAPFVRYVRMRSSERTILPNSPWLRAAVYRIDRADAR